MSVQKHGKPKATVLVVDDERALSDTLAKILRLTGYASFVAYNGSTALQRARELKPDMIISDVYHDAPNGIDMAIQIREELPGVKILLISGMAATAERSAKGLGLNLQSKPLHPANLIAWCDSGGQHDVRRSPGDCPCSWCRTRRALARVEGRVKKKLAATITVNWGYENHSITLTSRNWAKVKSGKELRIRGDGYRYDGEWFWDYWYFNRNPEDSLIVSYGQRGPDGDGFVGSLGGAEVVEHE